MKDNQNQKGRNLQKWTRERLIEELPTKSRSMWEDLIMASYSIECKNQERVNVKSYKPIHMNQRISKNHHTPLVVIDERLIKMLG